MNSNDFLEVHNKPFLDTLPAIVITMDIDTSRFTEYVWAYRATRGLNTKLFQHEIDLSNNVTIKSIIELFKEYNFKTQFLSNKVWRGYIVDETDPDDVPHLIIHLTHYNPTEPYTIVIFGDPTCVSYWEKHFLKETKISTTKKK